MAQGYTHRLTRNELHNVSGYGYRVHMGVGASSEVRALVTLTPDEARLLGLALIREADRSEEDND